MGFKQAVLLCLFLTLITSFGCQDDEWRTVATITPQAQPCVSQGALALDDMAGGDTSGGGDVLEVEEDLGEEEGEVQGGDLSEGAVTQDKTAPREPKTAHKPTKNAKKAAPQSPQSASPPAPPPPEAPAGCLDINAASIGALVTLPGVGQSRAQQIVQRRPFVRLRDLSRVKGIGPKTLERLIPMLCPLGK